MYEIIVTQGNEYAIATANTEQLQLIETAIEQMCRMLKKTTFEYTPYDEKHATIEVISKGHKTEYKISEFE